MTSELFGYACYRCGNNLSEFENKRHIEKDMTFPICKSCWCNGKETII